MITAVALGWRCTISARVGAAASIGRSTAGTTAAVRNAPTRAERSVTPACVRRSAFRPAAPAVGIVRAKVGTSVVTEIRVARVRTDTTPPRACPTGRCAVHAARGRTTVVGVIGAVIASVARAPATCPVRLAATVACAGTDLAGSTGGVVHPVSSRIALLRRSRTAAPPVYPRRALGAGIRNACRTTGLGALRAGSLAIARANQLELRGSETFYVATRGRSARRNAIRA